MKLYPPMIEGVLPAFYDDDEGTAKLVVPFSMNPTVSNKEYTEICLQLKTIQGTYINYGNKPAEIIDDKAIFYITSNLLNVGQFYKAQIAYRAIDGDVGYYSTVGVTKYTTKPVVYIENLSNIDNNKHQYSYVGVYENNRDKTEKVYSYKFDLFDDNGNIIKTSGELIHDNTQNSQLGVSEDMFDINIDLIENKKYYIQYSITTINGLNEVSPKYPLVQKPFIDTQINCVLVAEADAENGRIHLTLEGNDTMIGDFCIVRSSNKDDFMEWNGLYNFRFQSQNPHMNEWFDYNIEHGVVYKYAIQQLNAHGIKSNRNNATEITAWLEHSSLYDGERQLKIKFNPKVSSFKDVLMEQKTNTIGSKYPFIFRNGNVCYKEFPINGLISYQSDEDFLFTKTMDEYNVVTDLTYENIASEREFKLQVLNWLNNGKPKLFKSATEGNYIVRLMNSSLTPTDSLGRMIHSFSTTASEIADFTYQELLNYNIAKVEKLTYENINWQSINISSNDTTISFTNDITSLLIEGGVPFDTIHIYNDTLYMTDYGDEESSTSKEYSKGFEAQLDKNGRYYINLKNNYRIKSIEFTNTEIKHKGLLTYSYYNIEKTDFDFITGYEIESFANSYSGEFINIIEDIEQDSVTVLKINNIHAQVINENANTKITFADREIDVKDIGEYTMYNIDRVDRIVCGDGLQVDILCDIIRVNYEGDENDESST